MKYYLLVLLLLVSHFELYAQKDIGGEADGGNAIRLYEEITMDIKKFVIEVNSKRQEIGANPAREQSDMNVTLSLKELNEYIDLKKLENSIKKTAEINKNSSECLEDSELKKVFGPKILDDLNKVVKKISGYYSLVAFHKDIKAIEISSRESDIAEWSRELEKIRRNTETWSK